jgi:hypothetical protein
VLYPLSYGRIKQDVGKASLFIRPTLARRDVPFTKLRARVIQRLNLPKRVVRLASSLAAALPTALLSILIMVPTGRAATPSNRFTL